MVAVKDMAGDRFGRLTVVTRADNTPHGKAQWLCRCDCGTERVFRAAQLAEGRTGSCGCYRRERASGLNRSHGRRMAPEYKSWRAMKDRCLNEGHVAYLRYGGRGIQIHPAWRGSFAAFYADMGPRPEGTTLDRVNANGHYEPGNCRWASLHTQAGNKRRPTSHAGWKLTPESVRDIREQRAAGRSCRDLAAEHNVALSTIGGVVARTSWVQVP